MQVWIGRNGERFGPYEEAEVRQWLRDGTCRPEELGWHGSFSQGSVPQPAACRRCPLRRRRSWV
jgi:hypothetical protein